MDEQLDAELKRIYYDTAGTGSYGGVNRLYKEAKKRGLDVSQKHVQKFLTYQQAYTLHKPVRKTFARNHTYVSGIDKQWQADLADVQSLASKNDGIRFLLTVIDVFSKYAWVVPVKDKGAKSMLAAFKKLLSTTAPRKPVRLQTDKGNEFLCKPVQAFLRSRNIHHFVSNSDKKAAVVERFNRTLKTRMWAFFTAKATHRYIDNLPQFVLSYNKSYHRAIGMVPDKVRHEHETKIWIRLYGDGSSMDRTRKTTKPLKTGQMVRISRWKGEFEKGYLPNWTEENFKVRKVVKHPRTMYKLEDVRGESLKGGFYGEEVQRIRDNVFFVERVLRRRTTRDGLKEAFVKWKGWPDKFNTWITARELKKYRKLTTI